jgi:O-antigen ligase
MLSLSATTRPSAIAYGRGYDWGVLLLLFIIPFFPMPKTALGIFAPVSVVLLFGYLLLMAMTKTRDFVMDAPTTVILGCFLLLILLDLLNGLQFGAVQEFRYAFGRITSLMVILLVAAYLQTHGEQGVRLVMRVLLFSAVLVSVMIILEGFGFISYGFPSEEGRRLFGTRMPFRKATGVPLSDGKLGTLLIPAFIMLLIGGLTDYLKKSWRGLLLLVIGFAIVIMQSRSGWLGLFMGLAFLTVYYAIHSRYLAFYLLGMAALLAVLFFSPLGDLLLGGFVGEGVQARTVSGRFLGAEQALDASGASFLLGHGHGNVFIENEIGKTHIIHNLFLDQLASNGIMGLLALLFVYGFFLWLIVRSLWQGATPVILWLVTCWLSVFVEQNLYRGFYNEYISIYMALALFVASRFVPERKRRSVI